MTVAPAVVPDPTSEASPEFSLIAGHPALDLCNTVDWRLQPDSTFERLTSYDAVLAWARAVELVTSAEADAIAALPELVGRVGTSGGPGSAGDREVTQLREQREASYRMVIEGSEPDAYRLSRMAHEALGACLLTPGATGWEWAEPVLSVATPRRRALIALVDLVRSPAVRDVRQCADESCGWVYLDTSPRRNRRWCVSQECGNRNRVRRHYQRRRAASAR